MGQRGNNCILTQAATLSALPVHPDSPAADGHEEGLNPLAPIINVQQGYQISQTISVNNGKCCNKFELDERVDNSYLTDWSLLSIRRDSKIEYILCSVLVYYRQFVCSRKSSKRV